MMIRSLLSRSAVLLLAAGLLVSGAFAQEAQSVDPSKSEITEVAILMAKVEKVREEYKPRIDKTEDVDKNKELQLEQEKDIEEAIASSDKITPERYHEIVQAARSDKKLQKSIKKELKKARKKVEE